MSHTICIWRPARMGCVYIWNATIQRKCCRWNSIYMIIAGIKWPSGEWGRRHAVRVSALVSERDWHWSCCCCRCCCWRVAVFVFLLRLGLIGNLCVRASSAAQCSQCSLREWEGCEVREWEKWACLSAVWWPSQSLTFSFYLHFQFISINACIMQRTQTNTWYTHTHTQTCTLDTHANSTHCYT